MFWERERERGGGGIRPGATNVLRERERCGGGIRPGATNVLRERERERERERGGGGIRPGATNVLREWKTPWYFLYFFCVQCKFDHFLWGVTKCC